MNSINTIWKENWTEDTIGVNFSMKRKFGFC